MDDEQHRNGEDDEDEENLEERDTALDPEPEQEAAKKAKGAGCEEPDEEEAGGGAERRKHKRVKVKLHMVYEDGRTGIKTNVVNISMGGAFIEMAKPPQKGTEIRLTPVFPGKTPSENGYVQLKGKVVRVVEYNLPNMADKMGVGIEFTDMDGNESNVLSEIFRKCVDDARSEKEGTDVMPEEEDESAKTGEWCPPRVVDELAKTGEWVSPRTRQKSTGDGKTKAGKEAAEEKKEETDGDSEE
ncbi:MAG: PilZ domain-containing protein [Pseudomonadota bacterium]